MISVLKKWTHILFPLIRINIKLVFAGVFRYFIAAALGILIILSLLVAFNADSLPDEASAYGLLFLPGLIVLFYPTAYGIQNDMDARMMEVLIGIPNYRYKVWLFRMAIVLTVVFIVMFIFSLLLDLSFIPLDPLEMTVQLMYPMTFIAMFAFFVSTAVRNGHGTAALVVIFLLILLFAQGGLENTRWSLYLNPFDTPGNISGMIWQDTVFYNRVILIIASVLSLLTGMTLLQNRQRFL